MLCRLLNAAWQAGYRKQERRFRAALRDPHAAQQRLLAEVLSRNRDTAFGNRYRFDPAWDMQTYRDRVPLGDYASHEAYIEDIRRGRQGILTSDPVTHLIPTSGSTGARKLIPYTRSLKGSFDAALAPWIRSMFREHPTAALGPAYWSVSPAIPDDLDSAMPIGFEDDTAYLGPLGRLAVGRLLAVPSSVRHIPDIEAFRRATLTHLLRARNLSLISIWHPSFLSILLDALAADWPALLQQLPRSRARELARFEPTDIRGIWPRLTLVSTWADASAAIPSDRLRDRLPGVTVQPKGILSSECWTTIPYEGTYPLALTSHYFEFLDTQGNCKSASELDEGEAYEVVVTTIAGLYRYRTGDQVRVTGKRHATPTLQFIGRDRNTSDLCGEKLHESHVVAAIRTACERLEYQPNAFVLGPDPDDSPPRYVLAVTGRAEPPAGLADAIDLSLRANPHYDLCRHLHQLQTPIVLWIGRDTTIQLDSLDGKAPLGAIKPPILIHADAMRSITARSAALRH